MGIHNQKINPDRPGQTRPIAVRLSDDEMAWVREVARRRGVSLSVAVRRCVQAVKASTEAQHNPDAETKR